MCLGSASVRSRFSVHVFYLFFFFFFFLPAFVDFGKQYLLLWTVYTLFTHCAYTVYVLKNIKNGSHNTIYTFKYYFATVFSVFCFLFSTTISSIQTHPIVYVWIHVCVLNPHLRFAFLFFFFSFFFSRVLEKRGYCSCTVHWTVTVNVDFSVVDSALVYCSWTHKFHFSATFSLKMGLTALFTHLKIILR